MPTPNGALVTPDVAIRQVFDWFNANGGANRPFAEPPTVPGVNTKIGGSLDSPNCDRVRRWCQPPAR